MPARFSDLYYEPFSKLAIARVSICTGQLMRIWSSSASVIHFLLQRQFHLTRPERAVRALPTADLDIVTPGRRDRATVLRAAKLKATRPWESVRRDGLAASAGTLLTGVMIRYSAKVGG